MPGCLRRGKRVSIKLIALFELLGLGVLNILGRFRICDDTGILIGILEGGLRTGFIIGLRDGAYWNWCAGVRIGLETGVRIGLYAGLRTGLYSGLRIGLYSGLRIGLFKEVRLGTTNGLGTVEEADPLRGSLRDPLRGSKEGGPLIGRRNGLYTGPYPRGAPTASDSLSETSVHSSECGSPTHSSEYGAPTSPPSSAYSCSSASSASTHSSACESSTHSCELILFTLHI